MVKRLSSGGDKIRARRLNREGETFIPKMKIWMMFNNKPVVRDTSDGFWMRIKMIPFNAQFDPTKNQDIGEKLLQEIPGVLRWAIEGCLMWQHEGIGDTPKCVQEAIEEYQNVSYPLSEWLEDCIDINKEEKENQSKLYESYVSWSQIKRKKEREIIGSKTFYSLIDSRFNRRKSNGIRWVYGLSLKIMQTIDNIPFV
jgi:putative DNA primase/helicase